MSTRPFLGQLGPAARILAVLTVLLGLAYPLVLTGLAQVIAPGRADGSLVSLPGGRTVGSSLIGQSFAGEDRYLQSRPSAAGDGYDAMASSASNLALDSPELIDAVRQRRAEVAAREGIAPWQVPADAVTASGSGLDPHISPAYAAVQVARIARERGLSEAAVRRVVAAHTTGRTLGFLGEARVDVLEVNLALDRLAG